MARRSPPLVRVRYPRTANEAAQRDPWAGEDERWAAEDRAGNEPARTPDPLHDEDLVAPARGIVVGLLLVIPLWLLITAAAYAAYRAFF
jgi:hypothetical protein